MNMEIAVELFEMQTRGMMARMFQFRRVAPDAAHWEMLRGTREITMRDLANIAFDLGFDLDIQPHAQERPEPEGGDA